MDNWKSAIHIILKVSGVMLLNTMAGVVFLHAMRSETDYMQANAFSEKKRHIEAKLQLKSDILELEMEKLKHEQELLRVQEKLLVESKKIIALLEQMLVAQEAES